MYFNRLAISIISLFSLIQSYTVSCPNESAVCIYNYVLYKVTDSNAPVCWTKQTYGWSCMPRNESDCNDYNTLDISQCKYNPIPPTPPSKYCPKATDRCTNGGLSYLPTSPNAPPCWNKYNGAWNCASKQSDGKCNPSIFYVDITKCKYTPPPPTPPSKYCPKSTDRCTNGGLSYLPTDPNAPPCWNKYNGKWGCAYKQADGKCNPSIFYVDVTQCKYTPPPPAPPSRYCPKATDRCTNGGLSYLPTDPNAPPCWNKYNGVWGCAYKQADGKCNPSIFYVDITKCKYTPPPPTPPSKYCPKSTDRCTNGGLSYLPTSPNAPPCWNKYNGVWGCAYKQANGKCNPSIFYVDVTQCKYNYIPPVCKNGYCANAAGNSTSY